MTGAALRQARIRRGLTQQQLGEGYCDRSYISRIEAGKVNPPPEVWAELCRRLDLLTSESDGELDAQTLWVKMTTLGIQDEQPIQIWATLEGSWWAYAEARAHKPAKRVLDEIRAVLPQLPTPAVAKPILTAALHQSIADNEWDLALPLGLDLLCLHGETGEYEAARAIGRSFLLRKLPPIMQTLFLIGTGTAAFRLGLWREALVCYESVSSSGGHTQYQAQRHHGVAAALIELRAYPEALAHAARAIDAYETAGSEGGVWLARQDWGIAALRAGDRVRGMDTLLDCLVYWRRHSDPTSLLSILEEVAVGWELIGEREAAEACAVDAVGIAHITHLALPKQIARFTE